MGIFTDKADFNWDGIGLFFYGSCCLKKHLWSRLEAPCGTMSFRLSVVLSRKISPKESPNMWVSIGILVPIPRTCRKYTYRNQYIHTFPILGISGSFMLKRRRANSDRLLNTHFYKKMLASYGKCRKYTPPGSDRQAVPKRMWSVLSGRFRSILHEFSQYPPIWIQMINMDYMDPQNPRRIQQIQHNLIIFNS